MSIDPAATPAGDTLLVWNDLAPGTDPATVSTVAALPALPVVAVPAR